VQPTPINTLKSISFLSCETISKQHTQRRVGPAALSTNTQKSADLVGGLVHEGSKLVRRYTTWEFHPPSQPTKQVRMRTPHSIISFTLSKHMHLIIYTLLTKPTQPSSTGSADSITYSRAGLET
jgi:hypothetical protein